MNVAANLSPTSLFPFDAWASIYDQQCNPMTALEERHLEALLPSFRDKHVLEAGCGTGRWLNKIASHAPASLVGIDASSVMLDHARIKLRGAAQLHLGDCSTLPTSDRSIDVLLSSFVISYLDDLRGFAFECGRVLRPGGTLLVSDLNPDTASSQGWRRSFRRDGKHFEVPWFDRSLALILATFQQMGFKLQDIETPGFEEPEQPVFERSGKLTEFEKLKNIPAIYIVKLQKLHRSPIFTTPRMLKLTNALVASDPSTTVKTTTRIAKGRIASLVSGRIAESSSSLDMSGYLLLPGLINAHDHLEFALFPNLGRSMKESPYRNALEWSQEIHWRHTALIARHRRVPKSTRLWWGAIRNLLCGVTTVCHHNPTHSDFAYAEFPIRVVSNFRWSHSLAVDPNLAQKFCTTPFDTPFIIHAAEGLDQEAQNEMSRLNEICGLDDRMVFVHGLGLSDENIEFLNRQNMSVISCPTSNQFLFHQSLSLERFNSIRRIALGSDSPLTGAGDLLDEIRYAHQQIKVSAKEIYKMVTLGAAAILRLRRGEGQICESGAADLIAVRASQTDPAMTVANLSFNEIELVVVSGNVQVASLEIYKRLPPRSRANMQLLDIEGCLRWVRAPLDFLFASAESALGQSGLRLGGKAVRHVTAL